MADEGKYATTTEVQRMVPVGSSATSNAETYINQYIKMAERLIDIQCNFNFYAVYDDASFPASLKEDLRLAASALAAMMVMNYDTNGFGVLGRFQLQYNFLWTCYKEVIDKLKEDSYRKKMGLT